MLLRFPFDPRSGLVLCYYEPIKKTDYPDQKAKGYLPLWMVSKLEADVSSARPHFTLEYGHVTFTFKGVHQKALRRPVHYLTRHLVFFRSTQAFPRSGA
jgi:hypothetical protein